ncbi:hypothetical protein O3G_MSEX003021 [Manduca sexta]|uniref:Uncharacterized protein n=1 Tax=Manduca sexta TaxID=7130 RepID=A0A922CEB7_MANSE|nr:hypothetical protein O3G_MSEX003021 [Manduca sexta]KAG6443736.1 hypothetical protein O3G_MSEX003021 [Manduca sexta]KAG6443737.1 hypothetical protein O3G_MSEX003021 [Manduca sexta]KAG6443738.1 hypothetical protein O3G_MSEX003021 [Manduca sexta]
MKSVVLLLAMLTYMVKCLPPPHPDVEAVRREEELLPPSLRSPALHNPHLQEILPLSSLLHKGEKLVFEREAHDVSRKEIYNILTHAGLIPRKKVPAKKQHPQLLVPAQKFDQPNLFDLPFFPSQDFLQYL